MDKLPNLLFGMVLGALLWRTVVGPALGRLIGRIHDRWMS